MDIKGGVYALLLVSLILAGIKILFLYRTASMRTLARRLGLQFREGESHLMSLSKVRSLPPYLKVKGNPWANIRQAWNFIEGQKNGVEVLIFDSVLGPGRGVYSTFIAVKAGGNPFPCLSSEVKTAHSNGWAAIYRLRFWQIPWSMSVEDIEDYLYDIVSMGSK